MSTLKILFSLSLFGSAIFMAQNTAHAQGKGNCQRSQGQAPPSSSTGIVGSPGTTGLTTTATPVDPATGQQISTVATSLQQLIDSGAMNSAQQQRAATVLAVAARVKQTGVMTQSQRQILSSAYSSLQQMAAAANAQSQALASTSTTSSQQTNQTKASTTRAQAQSKTAAVRKQ